MKNRGGRKNFGMFNARPNGKKERGSGKCENDTYTQMNGALLPPSPPSAAPVCLFARETDGEKKRWRRWRAILYVDGAGSNKLVSFGGQKKSAKFFTVPLAAYVYGEGPRLCNNRTSWKKCRCFEQIYASGEKRRSRM